MTEKKPFNIGWLIAIAVIVVIVVFNVSYATPPSHHNDNDNVNVDTTVNVGGDTVNVPVDVQGGYQEVNGSTHRSKALALSNSLGDVDIAGCLGSTQWATPLFSKQKLSVNWACLAEFYLRSGKYQLAAMAMCNTEIAKEFTSEDDCRNAHDFTPQEPQVAPVSDDLDKDEEMHDLYQSQLYAQQMQIDELEQLVQKAPARTIVKNTEFLNADKRAKLEALRGEK